MTDNPVVNDRAGPELGSHASSSNPMPAMGGWWVLGVGVGGVGGGGVGKGCQQRHLLATVGMALQVMGEAGVSQELNSNLSGFLLPISAGCVDRGASFPPAVQDQILISRSFIGQSGVGLLAWACMGQLMLSFEP